MSEFDWYPGQDAARWTETPEQSAQRLAWAVESLQHCLEESSETAYPLYASFRRLVRLFNGDLARSPAVFHGSPLELDASNPNQPTVLFARLEETLFPDVPYPPFSETKQTLGVQELVTVALAETVDFVCSVEVNK